MFFRYERIDLLVALQAQPGVDPISGEAFDGAPIIKENIVLRRFMVSIDLPPEPVRRVAAAGGRRAARPPCERVSAG